MSRIRSSLTLKTVTVLSLLLLGSALLAFAATSPTGPAPKTLAPTELGTPTERQAVRTSRETALLPIRSSCTVKSGKELFITDVSVVDDCIRTTWTGSCLTSAATPATRGAWTVGKLLEGIFGTTNAATLSTQTINWLNQWATLKTINGDPVPARTAVASQIIGPWLAASGGTTLDMKKAPFRLLAIVARLDLRQNAGYSGGTSAGEGRFVFGLLDEFGNETNFLLILEYGLDATDCHAVLDWANAWHGLGAFSFGPGYNAALQAVTDRFTAIGASPGKPNGSAINQVRTNDFFLDFPWELRQFQLDPNVRSLQKPLVLTTVAQTPASSRQATAAISTYVNANEPVILAHQQVVPLIWNGKPFLGGAAPHSLDLGWDGPPPQCTSITNPQARHAFSLDTCSGCHGQETGVFFKHVEPRSFGSASTLSTFLTGGSATDLCSLTHTFGDINRRRVDLCQLLEKSCIEIDAEPVITFVH
jgi:hypothetical protein